MSNVSLVSGYVDFVVVCNAPGIAGVKCLAMVQEMQIRNGVALFFFFFFGLVFRVEKLRVKFIIYGIATSAIS